MKPLAISILILSCALTACTPMTATRGNLVDAYDLKEIQPGTDGKEDVVKKIGSPTTIAPFDDNTWYYLGQKTSKKGIMDPKITDEKIVVVTFAEDGLVDKVVERKDGREDIPITQRHTPTSGNDFTFMQQLLGNLGKFNKQEGNSATTASGGANP